MQTALVPFCRDCGSGTDHFTESHFRFDPSHRTTEAELRRIATLLSDGWRRACFELRMRHGITVPYSRWRFPYEVLREELGYWSDDLVTVQRVALAYVSSGGFLP